VSPLPRDPREIAAAALRRRDLSAHAIERRLAAAGVDEGRREETIAWLAESGLVDDARLAGKLATALAGQGRSDAAIDARLQREGLARETREAAIARLEPEAARARQLVRTAPAGEARRLAASLPRRGFGEDAVEAALVVLDGRSDVQLG
jgi:SOS response regulatory protein OraA/RecX